MPEESGVQTAPAAVSSEKCALHCWPRRCHRAPARPFRLRAAITSYCLPTENTLIQRIASRFIDHLTGWSHPRR
jgi:hypothetical protein